MKIEKLEDLSMRDKYPAPFLAHWPTGAVVCCAKHRDGIVGLGRFMGVVVPVSENLDENLECQNCINEKKLKS